MKSVEINCYPATGIHTWNEVVIPECFLQYVKAEIEVVMGSNKKYIFGLSANKRITGFVATPTSGGMIFREAIQEVVATSGMTMQRTTYYFKTWNMKIQEATKFWFYIFQDAQASDDIKITFYYSEKELQEVI